VSGVLGVVVAAASGRYILTDAVLSAGQFGYNGYNSGGSINEPSPAGALSPPVPFRGSDVFWIVSANSPGTNTIDLEINLEGEDLAQDFFTGVRLMDAAGSIQTFLTASATLQTATLDGGTRWQWSNGSTAIWLEADAGERFLVEFF
jgi:hypothetical protein